MIKTNMCIGICVIICLSGYLASYLYIYPFIDLSVCLSVFLSIHICTPLDHVTACNMDHPISHSPGTQRRLRWMQCQIARDPGRRPLPARRTASTSDLWKKMKLGERAKIIGIWWIWWVLGWDLRDGYVFGGLSQWDSPSELS
jgi:hypothetical protein